MKPYILLFFLSINCLAQEYKADLKVTYRFRHAGDSLKRNDFIESDNILYLNKDFSVYYNPEAVKYYDYLNKHIGLQNNSLNSIPTYPKSRAIVFRDYDKIQATMQVDKFSYTYKEPKLNWKLLPDIKKINGIECHLAKVVTDTKMTYYAWYTLEYPFSEGPFRFKGLPGLIIEVYSSDNSQKFTMIEIQKTDEIFKKIVQNRNVISTTKDKFLQIRSDYIHNPLFNTSTTGVIISDNLGTDYSRAFQKKYSHVNSFID